MKNNRKRIVKYKKQMGGNSPYDVYRINKIVSEVSPVRIKPYILDIKFHTHYRDVITALSNILPAHKTVFNKANLPTKYYNADYKELKEIASDFVILLTNQINRIPNERNKDSGWDEALPDPNIKSGWDKFTEKIGISNSLYEQNASNGNIYLIDIFNPEKHETDDEIRYQVNLIVGKELVEEQVIIKLCTVKDKRCDNKSKTKLVLEEISIIGYLSDYGDSNNPENTREPFYAFNELTKNDVINNHEIILELERNFTKKMDIVQNMLGTTEPDSRIFGPDLPSRTDLESYKINRTIFEDMKHNYF